jgi:dTDP-4-amino-4,6-dideoxygalactose transaminase
MKTKTSAFPQTGESIPFARPLIGEQEEEAVLRVLRSGWLTTGKEALAFEAEFSRFLGTVPAGAGAGPEGPPLPCLAVNSATSGLHLALEACGVTRGDLVLLPSYTFTASAEVVRYLGALPVFVDTAPDSFHMDSRALETTLERLSRGLRPYPPRDRPLRRGETGEGFGPRGRGAALIPVHYGGLPRDMDAVMDIARRYRLKVVEDAAHSFPSYRAPGVSPAAGETPGAEIPRVSGFAGTWGDAGVF